MGAWAKAGEAAKAEYKGKDKHKLNLLQKQHYRALRAMKTMKTVVLALALLCGVSAFSPTPSARWVTSSATRSATQLLATQVPEDTIPRFRKGVKQVATLGPKTFNKEMIEKLFLAGVDVFRLNLSHGAEDKAEPAQFIREIEAKYNRPIGILVDIQGPKHRVGMFPNPDAGTKVSLKKGQEYTFDLKADEEGDDTRCSLPHPDVMAALEVGHRVLIDDGKMIVVVREKSADNDWVKVEVMNDAFLSSRKGFNLPDTYVPGSAMTPKDLKDLDFCLKNIDFDWVALSFVQEAVDILELRKLMGDHPGKVIAKIEKPSAIDNLVAITDVCDGIMVARGDLGVEMLPEDVPMLQKTIIDECRHQGKPVIVATQMLESMMDNPAPTRAECSDIATAIFDGADAVMLSGESAAGKYPVESVAMQQKVITRVEQDPRWAARPVEAPASDGTFSDALMKAACGLARTMNAKAMVVMSESGRSVIRCSRERPDVPILAVTPSAGVARYLNLQKNVYATVLDASEFEGDAIFEKVIEVCKEKFLVTSDEDIVIATAGLPYGTEGAANVIRVLSGNAGKPPANVQI